jgi:uncharacterized membrane protein YuzA (DUF378 family)
MDTDLDAELATNLTAFAGAINWGAQETLGSNVLADIIGADNTGIAYLFIGAAGLVSLTETLGFTEIFEDN